MKNWSLYSFPIIRYIGALTLGVTVLLLLKLRNNAESQKKLCVYALFAPSKSNVNMTIDTKEREYFSAQYLQNDLTLD
jgi:hypothetical protein